MHSENSPGITNGECPWQEQVKKGTRTHIVSIANSYPASTAADTAVADVTRFLSLDRSTWVDRHRHWWHSYYPAAFLSLPDTEVETVYWTTMYKLGSATRSDRIMIDTAGIWQISDYETCCELSDSP